MGKLLEITNLKTYFKTREGWVHAVDGVSFSINEGEKLGIVGESGCGKSVTALSIMRLIPHPPGETLDGSIVFGEQDLLELSESAMRKIRGKQIGMIFQDPLTSLNPVLTIGSQIIESLKLHLGLNNQQAKRRAIELLREVGIPEAERRFNSYPHQFSGGMRQRVILSGDLPSPVNIPKGCRFHTRCPLAQAICRQEEPVFEDKTGNGHFAACHFSDQVTLSIAHEEHL